VKRKGVTSAKPSWPWISSGASGTKIRVAYPSYCNWYRQVLDSDFIAVHLAGVVPLTCPDFLYQL
jgi:hypothetical protein